MEKKPKKDEGETLATLQDNNEEEEEEIIGDEHEEGMKEKEAGEMEVRELYRRIRMTVEVCGREDRRGR